MSDLERELEFELHRVLDPISRMPIPARRPPAQAGFVQRLFAGAGAALALKAATGIVAAAALVTAAGAATTGSPHPQVWGQQVSAKVEACKAALKPGVHGIGECVSDFAQTHGSQVSAQHGGGSGAAAANGHRNDKGTPNGNGNRNGNGNANGNGNGHGNPNPPGPPAKTTGKPGLTKPGPPPSS